MLLFAIILKGIKKSLRTKVDQIKSLIVHPKGGQQSLLGHYQELRILNKTKIKPNFHLWKFILLKLILKVYIQRIPPFVSKLEKTIFLLKLSTCFMLSKKLSDRKTSNTKII